ncbi:MAG TPA: metal-dependent hydrolase [Acidimicrobiales bacterium]|nr:metal-dependent hydrolase [Acidimicrobiales bacterium]
MQTTNEVQTSNAGRTVPTRRMAFEEYFSDVPRHYAEDGDLVLSHVGAALSAVFPDGEDYFVRSVRHFRDDITDPDLKKQVGGFIGQESVHGREHRAFNDRLGELGYPTKRFESLTKKGLALRWKLAPAKANLAATAALEHFTATLAELVLTNEEVRGYFGHPAVQELFVWHALEESEHKAVAFDVYKAVGGTERTRVWTMKAMRAGFVLGMGLQVAISLLLDRETYKHPRKLIRSLRKFRRSPLVSRELWMQLKDYDRPDFHPDDRDTTALVTEWREKLFGQNGSLNDKLVRSAA